MLTKKQTLWALPILMVIFAALCLSGYVAQELLSIGNDGLFALIFISFSIFAFFRNSPVFQRLKP